MMTEQEPIILVRFGDHTLPFLVDTGATYLCINKLEPTVELSSKIVRTTGFLGLPQTVRFTNTGNGGSNDSVTPFICPSIAT